jgi:threonine dehydratase
MQPDGRTHSGKRADFCDGTAVRKGGVLPFQICQQILDRVETVTNAEVSSAIRVLWESLRCISGPSGAMGLAAALKNRAEMAGERVLIFVTGAYIGFLQLGLIAQFEGASSAPTHALRIRPAGHVLRRNQ